LGRQAKLEAIIQTKKIKNQRQGTFLHQARRAKVQERRQHETLTEILSR
ncbi:MAG: hypothetical protein ACI8WT_004892, partial [Clostridium sp.]